MLISLHAYYGKGNMNVKTRASRMVRSRKLVEYAWVLTHLGYNREYEKLVGKKDIECIVERKS